MRTEMKRTRTMTRLMIMSLTRVRRSSCLPETTECPSRPLCTLSHPKKTRPGELGPSFDSWMKMVTFEIQLWMDMRHVVAPRTRRDTHTATTHHHPPPPPAPLRRPIWIPSERTSKLGTPNFTTNSNAALSFTTVSTIIRIPSHATLFFAPTHK